ncbi:hypothetical protein EB796_023023 [Bugula neritina]|uniref:Uncharacterized protein n=1 Tax=Bugula neritina TaxID=10212 RepID=A0A7J7IXL4_BUGNE|nr:hypothetical protein EB796_023023 [Bugula neritina]
MNCFALQSNSNKLKILVVADEMEKKGWRMERQQLPDSLHFSILPQHIGQESKLISDLEAACKESWGKTAKPGDVAAMYGMIGKIPDQAIIDEFVTEYFSKQHQTPKLFTTCIFYANVTMMICQHHEILHFLCSSTAVKIDIINIYYGHFYLPYHIRDTRGSSFDYQKWGVWRQVTVILTSLCKL